MFAGPTRAMPHPIAAPAMLDVVWGLRHATSTSPLISPSIQGPPKRNPHVRPVAMCLCHYRGVGGGGIPSPGKITKKYESTILARQNLCHFLELSERITYGSPKLLMRNSGNSCCCFLVDLYFLVDSGWLLIFLRGRGKSSKTPNKMRTKFRTESEPQKFQPDLPPQHRVLGIRYACSGLDMYKRPV